MTEKSPCWIIQGGIIAAGQGTRLQADGYRVRASRWCRSQDDPLIELTLDRFRAVGIRPVTIIINETSNDCRQWLRDHAGDFDLDLIVRTTPSSYASFQTVVGRLVGAPAVITTIDAIMPVNDFYTFVRSAAALAQNAVALLTEHVDDENPLWATLDCLRRPHSATRRHPRDPCDRRALLGAGTAPPDADDKFFPASRLSWLAGCRAPAGLGDRSTSRLRHRQGMRHRRGRIRRTFRP